MDIDDAILFSKALVSRSTFVMVGSNGAEGYPQIKAMFNMEQNGLKEFWLSTNTSSKRVQQFKVDSRACLYFSDNQNFQGLMLTGEMEILQDRASRERLWREGCEIYYPQGIDDPDYSVMHFVAQTGNFYHQLQNVTFEISS